MIQRTLQGVSNIVFRRPANVHMISSTAMSFCRTQVVVGAAQAPLTAPVASHSRRDSSLYSRLQHVPKAVGLQRLRRSCTAAAADGVAMSNSWDTRDRTSELRELRSLNDWILNCASNWQGFTAHEGYAAIRKLVEVCFESDAEMVKYYSKVAFEYLCEPQTAQN